MTDILDWLHMGTQVPNFDERQRAAAEIERLREALKAVMDLPGEINLSNYNYDDVIALNNAHCEAFAIARAALVTKTKSGQ